jgi:hypothetical protein
LERELSPIDFILALGGMFLCVFAANRLAVRKGTSALAWMWAVALLGPFPLIPLALLPKLSVDRDLSF